MMSNVRHNGPLIPSIVELCSPSTFMWHMWYTTAKMKPRLNRACARYQHVSSMDEVEVHMLTATRAARLLSRGYRHAGGLTKSAHRFAR